MTDTPVPPKPLRGFALLSPADRKSMASLGGKSIRPENRTFSRRPDLAKSAGIKGGRAGKGVPKNG